MERQKKFPLFQDDDTLKTPAHDEMVCYCLKEQNVCKLIPSLADYVLNPKPQIKFHGGDDTPVEIWKAIIQLGSDPYKLINSIIVPEVIVKLDANSYHHRFKESWEKLVTDYKQIISSSKPKITMSIESEVPIKNGNYNNYIVGYWDIVIKLDNGPKHGDYFEIFYESSQFRSPFVYLEIKPSITSFGSTLRQLNTYQEFSNYSRGHTYLLTKDTRFNDDFESQGIKVLTFPRDYSDTRFT